MVIQAFVFTTFQEQLRLVATATNPVSASKPWSRFAGVKSNEQGAARCVSVKTWSAIVTIPVRSTVTGLDASTYPTVVPPLPLMADVIAIQSFVLTMVQAQSPGVFRVTELVAAANPCILVA